MKRRKTTSPKFLLLDACAIIKAHEIDVWDSLIERATIAVSSIVAHDEALFYSDEEGMIPPKINLPNLISKGLITELTANLEEIRTLRGVFDKYFNAGLHDGEAESLALLYCGKAEGFLYCSSDKVAIQGLAMLGLSHCGISMEQLLLSLGLQKSLSREYTDEFFRKYLQVGQQQQITGAGLVKETLE